MIPEPLRIQRIAQDTYDTFTLELEPPVRAGGFRFLPGQFNMLYVFGVGEVPISISGNPTNPQKLVHTTRAVGIVTRALRKLKRGDAAGVRGPFGSNWPTDRAVGGDVVIVAGGIGLAPLRPALYQILANRKNYGKVALIYGARTPDDLLYRKELERWRARLDVEVKVTVDRAAGGWLGEVGVVTTLIPRAGFTPERALALVCGPEVMMRFTAMELLKRGVSAERIYLSMERNMKCAVGFCGHCQYGPMFICKDGPIFRYDVIQRLLGIREV
jgi:NAD(P)H-flavin reductase